MDPYSTLGIDKNASDKDIKTAFKNLAKTHHPDRGGDETKFKQVNEAYQQIKNPEARERYNQEQMFGNSNGFNFNFQDGDMGGFDDLINSFFGGGGTGFRRSIKNKNIQISMRVTLEEVYKGNKKRIQIDQLGKSVDIAIPKAIQSGQTIRYKGLGFYTVKNAPPGDLMCKIYVDDHPYFIREGMNLYAEHSITCWEAISGCSINVNTIDGKKFNLKVPTATQPGTVMKIAEHGMMHPNSRMGDFFVRINVSIPQNLTEEQMNVIRDIARDTT
jgi:curved DNA-binding protein